MSITNNKKNNVLVLILFVCVMIVIFPYIWMLFTSFKPVEEVFSHKMRLLPHIWIVDNYINVLTPTFVKSIINSFIIISVGMVLDVVVAFIAGYAFAKLDFYGKNVMFFILLGTLMIPPQVLMLPSYLLVTKFRWQNTFVGLIVPRLTPAFGMFLIRQFILTVPQDIEEAATLDGSGILSKMFQMYWPICFPAITTVGVFSMIGYWNDYYWPLMIISDKKYQTVSLAIAQFKNLEGLGNWSQQMAAAVIATLPMIVLYSLARKTLIGNITAGAVKG
ncbi:MAG: carbohydrate ABC transporter permease [Sphaerochaetaceae bacterium]